jgi:hypothetical protein
MSIIELRMQKGYHNPYISEMCNTNLCECGIRDNILACRAIAMQNKYLHDRFKIML